VAGVVILLALDRRFSFRRSRLFWLYAMYYTLGRVWIEAMRIDDAEQVSLFGITTRLNVWTSILVFVLALAAFILLGLKKRTEPDTVYLPGREPAEKDAAVAANGAPEAGVTGTPEPSRDTDTVVSDSESRDNLPDNQSGSTPASVPADQAKAAPAGTTPGPDAKASGHSGSTATGTAPEAGTSK
jgi:hypothetical protein